MVKRSPVFLVLTALVLMFSSCVREYSLENGLVSSGALQKDQNGNCLPVMVAGTYIAGKQTGDTNTIRIGVEVTGRGRFLVTTDTLNGYAFQASGNFSDTGFIQISLIASGKPLVADTDHFTITFNSSVCDASVVVNPNGLIGKPALYALEGAPNSCTNDTVAGGYVQGVVLDTSDRVDIRANVTVAGTYAISTDTVDGYYFSGSGTFAAAGVQTVTLTGFGTPQHQGSDVFRVNAGTSVCSFSVPVEQIINVTNNDHFPLTPASFWNYDDPTQSDTLSRRLIDTTTINGNVYSIVEQDEGIALPVPYFFRKTGNDYYEYGSVDKYTNSVAFIPQVMGDILFLKENLATGDLWLSAEYSGPIQGGQVVLLQYVFSCIDASATVVVNGKAFSNVYKIVMKPQVKSVGGAYDLTGETYNLYYGRGVGLVYFQKTAQGYSQYVQPIRNWLVN